MCRSQPAPRFRLLQAQFRRPRRARHRPYRQPSRHLPRERLLAAARAKRVILANGAIERHMVFPNNDRPGIMLASAARMYLNQYGVAVGQKVGVYTAHDSAYEAAFDLKRAGVEIAAIVDSRQTPGADVLAEARSLGIDVLTGQSVINTSGKLRIASMTVARNGGSSPRKIMIDALCWSRPDGRLWSTCSRSRVAGEVRARDAALPAQYLCPGFSPSAPATAPTTCNARSRNRWQRAS